MAIHLGAASTASRPLPRQHPRGPPPRRCSHQRRGRLATHNPSYAPSDKDVWHGAHVRGPRAGGLGGCLPRSPRGGEGRIWEALSGMFLPTRQENRGKRVEGRTRTHKVLHAACRAQKSRERKWGIMGDVAWDVLDGARPNHHSGRCGRGWAEKTRRALSEKGGWESGAGRTSRGVPDT